MTKPAELDERALMAALGCYSEGGCLGHTSGREITAATHWMPLPAAPDRRA